jgi:hypothetical protein
VPGRRPDRRISAIATAYLLLVRQCSRQVSLAEHQGEVWLLGLDNCWHGPSAIDRSRQWRIETRVECEWLGRYGQSVRFLVRPRAPV